jgi:hypothetical protein
MGWLVESRSIAGIKGKGSDGIDSPKLILPVAIVAMDFARLAMDMEGSPSSIFIAQSVEDGTMVKAW